MEHAHKYDKLVFDALVSSNYVSLRSNVIKNLFVRSYKEAGRSAVIDWYLVSVIDRTKQSLQSISYRRDTIALSLLRRYFSRPLLRTLSLLQQVFTISLLADKKYHHFRPVLDAYIEDLFGATKADQ